MVFLQFWAATYILRVNWPSRLKIDQDHLHMKFSALNVYFSSPGIDRLGSRRRHMQASNRGTPQKVVILLQLASVALRWLHIGTNMLLVITITSNELLSGVNVDELE